MHIDYKVKKPNIYLLWCSIATLQISINNEI